MKNLTEKIQNCSCKCYDRLGNFNDKKQIDSEVEDHNFSNKHRNINFIPSKS